MVCSSTQQGSDVVIGGYLKSVVGVLSSWYFFRWDFVLAPLIRYVGSSLAVVIFFIVKLEC